MIIGGRSVNLIDDYSLCGAGRSDAYDGSRDDSTALMVTFTIVYHPLLHELKGSHI